MGAHIEGKGQLVGVIFPPILRVPEIEPKSPGLVASAFP